MFGTRELTQSFEPGAVSRLFSGVVRFVAVCFLISIVELAAVSAAERAVIILAPAKMTIVSNRLMTLLPSGTKRLQR